ncbi:MFS transporter [Neokomagataea tanensis]|nr:hypothetical protein [Neokomagataea tanensis]
MNPAHYGMLFGVFAVGSIGASAINGVLVGRVNGASLMLWALVCALIGSVASLGIGLLAEYNGSAGAYPEVLLVPMIIAVFLSLAPTGIAGPNAMASALSAQEGQAGSAAALAGTIQYVFGALASALFGLCAHRVAVSLSLFLLGAYALAVILAAKSRSAATRS